MVPRAGFIIDMFRLLITRRLRFSAQDGFLLLTTDDGLLTPLEWREVHCLGLLPYFRGPDRQPELGLDHVNRTARSQPGNVIGNLIFTSSRKFQFDLEHVLGKKIGAGIGRESAVEVGFLY